MKCSYTIISDRAIHKKCSIDIICPSLVTIWNATEHVLYAHKYMPFAAEQVISRAQVVRLFLVQLYLIKPCRNVEFFHSNSRQSYDDCMQQVPSMAGKIANVQQILLTFEQLNLSMSCDNSLFIRNSFNIQQLNLNYET